MTEIPTVPKGHAEDICKQGKGAACCKYLIGGPEGLECAKSSGNEHFKRTIDDRTMVAKGDNCGGFRG